MITDPSAILVISPSLLGTVRFFLIKEALVLTESLPAPISLRHAEAEGASASLPREGRSHTSVVLDGDTIARSVTGCQPVPGAHA